jgi:hypothetical protein
MENFGNKKASFPNDLNTQEKLLYGTLGILLIFGFIYFILPFFFKEPPISLSGACDIVLQENDTVIAGWAFDRATGQTGKNIIIHFLSKDRKNEVLLDIKQRLDRPDVSAAFHLTNVNDAGFGGRVPIGDLSIGENSIVLEQIASDGTRVLCGTDKNITRQ